jgi:hypothetical protein
MHKNKHNTNETCYLGVEEFPALHAPSLYIFVYGRNIFDEKYNLFNQSLLPLYNKIKCKRFLTQPYPDTMLILKATNRH